MSNITLPLSEMLRSRASKNPRLREFTAAADNLIQADPDGGFYACGAILASICRDGVFTDLVNYELDCLLHDPDYALEASSDADMLVWKSAFFTLVLKIATEPQKKDRLFAQPFNHFLAPVSAKEVKLSRYQQPRPHPNDVFDRSRRLVFRGEETIVLGASSYFRAGEDIFLIHSDAQGEAPPLLVCFASPNKLAIRWEYDAATLAPVRAVASDTSASRLEFLAWMMSAMNNRDSLTALRGLSVHPAHFVRWAALQSIFRLDREMGVASLRSALEDPHEHVRNAARRSLAKIDSRAEIVSAT